MKKVIGIGLSFLLCSSLRAQVVIALLFGEKLNTGKVEFGLVVSPVLTTISDLDCKLRPGLNLSLYFNVLPDNKLFLHVEAVGKGPYGAKGIPPYPTGNDSLDQLLSTGLVERTIQTFGLPVLARYRLAELFFAEAGIQPNLRLKARDVFQAKVGDNDLDYTIKISDQITQLDFGLTWGFFYKFRKDRKSMGIGIRYFYGLTDTHKTLEGHQANRAWLLNVAIPIGAGKTAAAGAK